jgi:hypothetical protein
LIPVGVVRVLRQDSGDQLIERRERMAPDRVTIGLVEPPVDLLGQAFDGVHAGIIAIGVGVSLLPYHT